jgi:hypothetical protein
MNESGFDIEVELDNDDDTSNREDKVRIFISLVNDNSEAMDKNMQAGDEIVIINGSLIETLDIDKIQYYLNVNETLRLTLKTARLRNEMEFQPQQMPTNPSLTQTNVVTAVKSADQLAITEALINELICPPPPSCLTYKLNNETIDSLIVPAPEKLDGRINGGKIVEPVVVVVMQELKLRRQNGKASLSTSGPSDDTIKSLLQECERVNVICRMETEFVEQPEEVSIARVKPLTNAQKLRKVIFELVETEKNYVKVIWK